VVACWQFFVSHSPTPENRHLKSRLRGEEFIIKQYWYFPVVFCTLPTVLSLAWLPGDNIDDTNKSTVVPQALQQYLHHRQRGA
jgi:hypothetical protein